MAVTEPQSDSGYIQPMVLSPESTPGIVSEGIADLANQTFDRLAGRLAVYAADERRARGENGTTLTADNEGVLWEGGAYGRVPITITDKTSRQEVWEAFLKRQAITGGMSWPTTTHHTLIKEANERSGPDRYKPVAAMLLLSVLRDRFPRGDTDYRESLMRGPDYSNYPSEDWGERHKVGIELNVAYEDALAPERPTTWRFDMSVQTRFDKPVPQTRIRSRLSGLIDTNDIKFGDFKPEQKQTEQAHHVDLAHMRRLFELAKDIRPQVTPIETQLKQQAAEDAMLADLFSSMSSESTPV